MKFLPTPLAGCFIVEPQRFQDERGHFFETYHQAKFYAGGITVDFVQDNQSRSRRNVIRGQKGRASCRERVVAEV